MKLRCCFLLLAAWLTLPAIAAPDVENFVRKGAYRELLLSPDGRHLAATFQLPDRIGLAIIRREGMQAVARATGEKDSAIAGFKWIDNERLLVAPAEQFGELDEPRATGELVLVSVDGSRPRKLFDRHSQPKERDGEKLAPDAIATAELIDVLAADPDRIMIGVREWSGVHPRTSVEYQSLESGRRRALTRTPVHSATVVLDASGEPRLSFGFLGAHSSLLYHRRAGEANWSLVNDEAENGRSEFPLGFSADGRSALLRQSQESGPDVVVAWDPDSGERRVVARHDRLDPAEVLRDDRGAVIGIAYLGSRRQLEFFDSEHPQARMQRALERAFPGADVYVQPAPETSAVRLVEVRSERDPGTLFLFDVVNKRADFLMRRLPGVEPERMAAAEVVRLSARDGLELEAVLTRPTESGEGPWPLILRPHGGPFGVFDRPDFDPEVQLLAAAGYAVLQVNFRGSGNYGHTFRSAGARQWGRAMQDDLDDAVKWAVEQGIAIAGRVCLVGASYGAYAALIGVAREPDIYACAVGAFGVYDLRTMAAENRRFSRNLGAWSADWVGTPDSLQAVSPTHLAERIRAPVLLIAGNEDLVAPLVHSRRMRSALKRAGRPPEHWFVPGVGHGFVQEAHQREYFERLLAFLARNLADPVVDPTSRAEGT